MVIARFVLFILLIKSFRSRTYTGIYVQLIELLYYFEWQRNNWVEGIFGRGGGVET